MYDQTERERERATVYSAMHKCKVNCEFCVMRA